MGGHILVVDDEDAIRSLLAQLLRSRGYKVTTAEDGIDALCKLNDESETYSGMLTDLIMPHGLHGDELLRIVRGTERLRDLPVIVVSANAILETERKLLEDGANAVLAKPIPFEMLLSTVEQHIPNGRH